ncbi:MAG: molybdate ABC transporter substrate-binding protein [Limnohabitans sp.]|nr:molybdate ABC transporter substrate-binding protein [Limnohabitans sp.]
MQKMHDVMSMCAFGSSRRQALAALLTWPWAAQAQTAERFKVAAASNLKFVLADITSQYRQQTGVEVELILGASGHLSRQILQGLPVQQFISADEERVQELVKAGRTVDAGQRYARGRLALVVPKNSALPSDQGLPALVLAMKPADKFAIANPALAPYGLAAEQALQRSGARPLPVGQKVLGENIGQTTQFVATGAAQAGITALALASAPEMAASLRYAPLSESLHDPLHQRMVLLQGAGAAARAWHRYLLGPQAQAIFVRHGYALPQ